jgi:hypothetical protein
MNRTWVGVAIVAASLMAGCGPGRAIFNVDAYSWLKGSKNDTVPYVAPPATNDSASTVTKINLPGGLGSSLVDTVQVTGTMDLRNQSGGPATLGLQVYLASDSASTYTASRDSILTPPISGTVSGSGTTPVVITANNLSPKGDSLFTKSQVWVRIVARVANATLSVVQGKAVLTGLQMHVVVQDKIF